MWPLLPLTFILTYVTTLGLEGLLKERNMMVPDVHKKGRPMVPMPGGPAIMLGLAVLLLGSYLLAGDKRAIGVFILALSGFLIGFYDDLTKLGGKQKVLLLLIPGLLLAISGLYNPRPILPFIGPVRLTMIYPILLVIASTVVANGVNMIDVFNGLVSSAMIIATIPLLIIFWARGDMFMFLLALGYVAVLAAFYIRHRHPSKIFPGDSGSVAMGLGYMGLIIEGNVEVLGIVALLPMILNGFFIISSLGGFIEHEDIKERPTETLEEGLVVANKSPGAPLTLTRLLIWGGPLPEREIVHNIILLFGLSALLSIITIFMGGVT